MGDHRGEIEELLISETGKSAVDAAQEVPMLIMILSYYIRTAEKALAPEKRPAALPFMAIKKITVHYRPRPVVGVIAPWNYPVANALMDGIGALAAGQRHYYSGSTTNCAKDSTTAVTILAGPLNYFGANPKEKCKLPQPSK